MSGRKQLCLFVFVIAFAIFFSPLFICYSNAGPAPPLVISGPSNMTIMMPPSKCIQHRLDKVAHGERWGAIVI